jgi:hypothetical protein
VRGDGPEFFGVAFGRARNSGNLAERGLGYGMPFSGMIPLHLGREALSWHSCNRTYCQDQRERQFEDVFLTDYLNYVNSSAFLREPKPYP